MDRVGNWLMAVVCALVFVEVSFYLLAARQPAFDYFVVVASASLVGFLAGFPVGQRVGKPTPYLSSEHYGRPMNDCSRVDYL